MRADWHFWVMIPAAAALFIVDLALVVGVQPLRARLARVAWVTLVVVGGGMVFGRYGARLGLPWWVYYPLPAAMNLTLPPGAFHMTRRQTVAWVGLAVAAAPVLHVGFSLGLGWNEYLPFWPLTR